MNKPPEWEKYYPIGFKIKVLDCVIGLRHITI